VANLIARTPFDGLLPLAHGTVEASEVDPGTITSVAPFAGQAAAVSSALKKAIGCELPPVGAFTENGATRIAWSGLDQWFVMSPVAVTIPGAALTDQSDAWAAVQIEGADARAVLTRLVPVDLRPAVFEVGHAARTSAWAHVLSADAGGGRYAYVVLVFRSMAASAAHDLDRAMRMVAARSTD
jgi:heterotetrameric sarcosine oxidase gamma subunit